MFYQSFLMMSCHLYQSYVDVNLLEPGERDFRKLNDVNGNFQNPRVQKLADQIENIKSNQEVGVKYMRLWEELDDAKKEGREESQIDDIRNLMDSLSLSMEQAMDALKIPEDKREEYKKQLEMND